MKPGEVFCYGVKHPGEIVKVLVSTPVRQMMVGCDLELPPSGSAIEEFPRLPYHTAVAVTLKAKAEEHQKQQ